MSTCTCYYVDFMVYFSCFLFLLYVGYKHGARMCSSYGSCSWFDKLLDGWWIHGLTIVVAARLRGYWSFLVILRWSSEVYDHICIHDM